MALHPILWMDWIFLIDPGLYRSKESLKKTMEKDPLVRLKQILIEHRMLTEEEFVQMDEKQKELVILAMRYADESPWPDPITLEEGVLAPEEKG